MNLKNNLNRLHSKKNRFKIFVAIFSLIGGLYFISTFAATPYISNEIEDGGLTGSASIISDSNASGGNAVLFGGSARNWRPSAITGGGYVNSISYSPTDDASNVDSLRAVVVTDVSGIFFTNNGGTSWIPANGAATSGNDLRSASVLWHPSTPGLVFVFYGNCTVGSGGIMRSTDYGQHWTKMSSTPTACGNGLSSSNSQGLPARQPRIVGRLMGIDETNGFIYAGTFETGIMRASLSNLGSWTTIALGQNTSGQGKFYIRGLTVDDQDPTVVYASTYDGTNSDDGDGRIWRIKNANTTPIIEKLSNSPIDTEDVFSLEGNLYAANAGPSIEGGVNRLGSARTAPTDASFKKISGPAYSTDSCAVANAYSGGGCTVWFSVNGYVSGGVTTLWVGASNPPNVGGVFKPFWKGTSSTGFASDDGSWTGFPVTKSSVKNDILGPSVAWWKFENTWAIPGYESTYDVGDIAVGKSPTDPVFEGGQTAIWRSTNNGVDWYPSLDGFLNLVNREVVIDPNDPAKVYQTNVDYRLFESSDHMQTVDIPSWPSGMTSDGWSIAIDSFTNPSTMYLGLGDRDTNTGGQLWQRDGAGTWLRLDGNAFGGLRITGLGVTRDGSNNPVIIAAVQESGLWKKVGSGAWTKLSIASPSTGKNIMTNQGTNRAEIQIAPGSSTFYVYDRDTGLWRGDNYGSTWTRIYSSPSDSEGTGYTRVHPNDPKVVFVSDSTGVYRITNADVATKDAATATKISGTISNPGAMTIGSNNSIYFVTTPTSTARPRIYQGDYSQTNPTWTDLSDDYFQSYAIKIITIAASSDGTLYASSNNNSSIVLDK